MPISISLTEAPTTPQRTDPENFRVLADQFVDWLANTFGDEMNTVITDFNATIQNLYVGTSTTSIAIGTGSKTFEMVEDNLAFGVGTELRVAETANPTANYMSGIITAYDKTTKSLTLTVDTTNGSGTIAAWTMTMEPREDYNRVRTWSAMTGAAAPPLVAYHSSKYWELNTSLADVTAKTPGVDSEWDVVTHLAGYEEITTSQNWTPTVGATWALVYCIGAGAGGSYNTSTAVSGGAGGEGFFKLFRISDLTTPVSVTIGAGGSGGTNASKNGVAGGNTTFGAYLTAYGGRSSPTGSGDFTTSQRKSDVISSTDYPALTDWYVGFHEGLGAASSIPGGSSIYGGAGGGSRLAGGGTSEFAGAGGNGGDEASATNGTAPGGGGGGVKDAGGADLYVAGDGADGACRIWQW